MPNQNDTKNNNNVADTSVSATPPIQTFDDTVPPPPITENQPVAASNFNTAVPETPPVAQSPSTITSDMPSVVINDTKENVSQPPPPTPAEIPPVVTTTRGGSFAGGLGKKRIATILGLLLLVGGASAGVFLVQQNQNVQEKAEVTTCTGCMANGVCITDTNNFQCGTNGEACTACQAGTSCTNGACVATTQAEPEIKCLSVKAYSVDEEDESFPTDETKWTELTQTELSNLEAGDIVFFTITGRADDPSKFTQVKFKVNDTVKTYTTPLKMPIASDEIGEGGVPRLMNEVEFYHRYIVPANVTEFSIEASIYHEDQGWIDPISE